MPNASSNSVTLSPSPQLLQSLQTIKLFIDLFPPATMEEDIWKLAFNFINNKEESEWLHIDRTNIFFIYDQLIKLGKAITVIDKELGPLNKQE